MLRRLYSTTGLFPNHHEFTFEPGINFVLGRYSEPDRDKRLHHGINGIGKSSLIRLISYLFVSDRAEKLLRDRRYDFLRVEDHTVGLEISVRGENVTIQRRFADKLGTVDIGYSGERLRSYSTSEAKKILSGHLFPPEPGLVLEGDRFRSLMHFFVKDDLDHQKRSDVLNFFATTHSPNEREKMALNFFLLGIPNEATWTFDSKLIEYKTRTARVRDLAKRIEGSTNRKFSELKAEVDQRQERMQGLRSALNKLDLLEGYRDIESTLTTISAQFSEKSSAINQLSGQLRRLRKLSEVRYEVQPQEIEAQFAVFSESLGSFVRKQLDEVLTFRTALAESRSRFHESRIKDIETNLGQLRAEVVTLEEKRRTLLQVLDEKGALQPLRATYEQLFAEQGDLERELQVFREIDDIQRDQASLDVEISKAKQEMLVSLESADEILAQLRKLFRDIAEEALGLDASQLKSAFFDVSTRAGARRDVAPTAITVSLPRNDALGRARFEIVAYDLMVFLAAARRNRLLPDFLIHDGVFHGTSRRTIVSALNFVHKQRLTHPSLQYIVTFNEDEIPLDQISTQRDGSFNFDVPKATVATFTDDPSGMIFGKTFD